MYVPRMFKLGVRNSSAYFLFLERTGRFISFFNLIYVIGSFFRRVLRCFPERSLVLIFVTSNSFFYTSSLEMEN